jgi:hypothetical protein
MLVLGLMGKYQSMPFFYNNHVVFGIEDICVIPIGPTVTPTALWHKVGAPRFAGKYMQYSRPERNVRRDRS